ncbi:MAG: hypothetical protein WAZ48_06870 [Lysobacteraceae bacterium]
MSDSPFAKGVGVSRHGCPRSGSLPSEQALGGRSWRYVLRTPAKDRNFSGAGQAASQYDDACI